MSSNLIAIKNKVATFINPKTVATVLFAYLYSDTTGVTNDVLKVINAISALYAWYEKKWKVLLYLLCMVPKFSFSPHGDKINLFSHLIRYITFRRVDLKLPQKIPTGLALALSVKLGLWQRHRLEQYTSTLYDNKPTCFYGPLSRYSKTRPLTMYVFITDPKDCEQILTDQESFPSRGTFFFFYSSFFFFFFLNNAFLKRLYWIYCICRKRFVRHAN